MADRFGPHRLRRLLRRVVSGVRTPATPAVAWSTTMRQVTHEVPPEIRERFRATTYRERDFFPHRIRYLPKSGPDGLFLAKGMAGIRAPESLWQVVIHATPPVTDEFPRELFFDRDVLWHQQHFHEPGQVASATMAIQDSVMYTMAHQSDLVQRISRRRDLKTRVDKVFGGWHHLLLNAIAHFAVQRGCRELRVPTSALMMRFTDPNRTVQPTLFERVYDRAVAHHFTTRESGGWWCIDLKANRSAIVAPLRRVSVVTRPRTLCVVHDIERGLGHRAVNPEFAQRADVTSDDALTLMLDTERAAGVAASYMVVGTLLGEIRDRIEWHGGRWRGTQSGGHTLGFHSHDHGDDPEQLRSCRRVDYRLKGYRPPMSRLTPELGDEGLCRYNFEWLASSASSLETRGPRLGNRVVRIPIHGDDFPLHTGRMDFPSWRASMRSLVANQEFTAIGLHDCYASTWQDNYASLLDEWRSMATLRTLDEIADEVFLAAAV